MEKLIEALEKKRGETSIPVFATNLGMHYSTYYRLLKGERGIGADLQRRIITRYPELALVFLSSFSPFVDTNSTQRESPPESPQPPRDVP